MLCRGRLRIVNSAVREDAPFTKVLFPLSTVKNVPSLYEKYLTFFDTPAKLSNKEIWRNKMFWFLDLYFLSHIESYCSKAELFRICNLLVFSRDVKISEVSDTAPTLVTMSCSSVQLRFMLSSLHDSNGVTTNVPQHNEWACREEAWRCHYFCNTIVNWRQTRSSIFPVCGTLSVSQYTVAFCNLCFCTVCKDLFVVEVLCWQMVVHFLCF